MNKKSSSSSHPRVAIFWDWQNTKATEWQIQCVNAFAYQQGIIDLKKVYADWQLDKDRKLAEKLHCEGFKGINVFSCKEKPNCTDQELIYDCRKYALEKSEIDIVIVLSGDGDFTPLVRELKARDKRVIVVAQFQKNVSQKLKESANEFYLFSQIEQWYKNLKFSA
ncbi:MAG: NYN domain-containing protein [Hydrococcus sp. Prado102]|nr:NYN domain-containing protein [Hydrococcus sp. Prado102]